MRSQTRASQTKPSSIRILDKPIRIGVVHEIRNVELAIAITLESLMVISPAVPITGRINQTRIRPRRERQAGHVEEIKHVQILELVRGRGARGRDGFQLGAGGFGLAGDEEVEVVGAAPHVGQDADGGRGFAHAVDARGRALAVVVFFEDAREEDCVALGYVVVVAHFSQGLDEGMDRGVDLMVDRGAVDEQ